MVKVMIMWMGMTLPKGMENRSSENRNRVESPKRWSPFAECWGGLGLWSGIWAVTFGVVASGILPM